ncbi:MAG: LiaF-related protein [Actinomycetota bacterium]|nr:LiaF-related protein [Actinomycetota bacterium]
MAVPSARPATLGASVAFGVLAASRLADAAFDIGLSIGLSLGIAAVAGVLAAVGASANVVVARRSGELHVAPEELGPDPTLYELVAGEIHLDLTNTRLSGTPTVVHANLRAGEIEVAVPDDRIVEVHTRGLVGEATVFGDRSNGLRPRRDVVPVPEPDLVLHLVVTVGEIEVTWRNREPEVPEPGVGPRARPNAAEPDDARRS